MRYFLLALITIWTVALFGQSVQSSTESINARYFEDQFYLGVTYNFIRNKPEGLKQRNLSYGLMAGFIKDLPLNATGTSALGIGLGFALNTYYSNVSALELDEGFSYAFGDTEVGFKRSKLETHAIEFPIQFRWRNSTRTEYKFWRLYTGLKLSYIIGARSKLVTSEVKDGFFNTDVDQFQYGPTINFGYNTFNVHIYYGLTDLFNPKAQINGEGVGFRPLRVGLIFYIL